MEMRFRTWGGKRAGAGRKPSPGRQRVSHGARPKLASRFPVHVTTRIRRGVPSLRRRSTCAILRAVLLLIIDQPGFRICQFSIQRDHLHLICEASSQQALARGIKRFKQTVARRINKQLGRTGSVFDDRYHMRILRTPREVRHALAYVLHNGHKHGAQWGTLANGVATVDPCTSAWWFDGWRDQAWRRGLAPPAGGACVAPPRTWLLDRGWRRHGLIGSGAGPGEAPTRSRSM